MNTNQDWKLVPIEPTAEMWAAVNKLDDQMAAGGYDGKGASIEQAWNCLVETAPAAPPLTVVLDPDPRGVSVGVYQGSSCVYIGAHPIPTGATGEDDAPRYQWLTTVAQMKVLAAELTLAAETMGGDDDESAETELILSAAKPGTVQDDDGASNTAPILTVHLAEYPEEGVYPIDPCDPTGGRIDSPAPAAGDALELLKTLEEVLALISPVKTDKDTVLGAKTLRNLKAAEAKIAEAIAQQSQRKEA